MNRRAFFGAFGALLALPAAALASRSVPRWSSVGPAFSPFATAKGCRLRFTPFGELDWIELPSEIVDVLKYAPNMLAIRCLDGFYMLAGFPDPSAMVVTKIY